MSKRSATTAGLDAKPHPLDAYNSKVENHLIASSTDKYKAQYKPTEQIRAVVVDNFPAHT